jgi:hypothetical protein
MTRGPARSGITTGAKSAVTAPGWSLQGRYVRSESSSCPVSCFPATHWSAPVTKGSIAEASLGLSDRLLRLLLTPSSPENKNRR